MNISDKIASEIFKAQQDIEAQKDKLFLQRLSDMNLTKKFDEFSNNPDSVDFGFKRFMFQDTSVQYVFLKDKANENDFLPIITFFPVEAKEVNGAVEISVEYADYTQNNKSCLEQ